MSLVKADNGMSIVGQGIRIILFTLPAIIAAVAAHRWAPDLVLLPLPKSIATALGAALVLAGLVMWATAVSQLLIGFSRGKLVRTGAYGVCRNPIYGSVAFFVLPGLALATGTWVYLLVAAALCLGVVIFIRKEERDLLRVFGEEYRRYMQRVHRIIPFLKPRPIKDLTQATTSGRAAGGLSRQDPIGDIAARSLE